MVGLLFLIGIQPLFPPGLLNWRWIDGGMNMSSAVKVGALLDVWPIMAG